MDVLSSYSLLPYPTNIQSPATSSNNMHFLFLPFILRQPAGICTTISPSFSAQSTNQ